MAISGEPVAGNSGDGVRLMSPAKLDGLLSILRGSLESGADEKVDAVVAELSKTCGVHASPPPVVSLFHATVSQDMSVDVSSSAISSCVRAIRALLANPHFVLESYVVKLFQGLLLIAGLVLGGWELGSAADTSLRGQTAEVRGDFCGLAERPC